jgi:hypothetical protein
VENGIKDDELELYAERLNLLSKLYKKSPNRFVVDLDMLKATLQKPEVVLNDMSFVCGKTISVPQSMFIEMFKESVKLMENEENFHVCLTSSRALKRLRNTEIVAKENSRIIFGCVYGERPKTLVTKELTVVTALYSYFDELWNSTPYISRNKEYVSNQISKQISEQEKRMGL